MRLFLPREDWVSLSRALRGPLRKWWLRVGIWWLLLMAAVQIGTLLAANAAASVLSVDFTAIHFVLYWLIPNLLAMAAGLKVMSAIEQIAGSSPVRPEVLAPLRYWFCMSQLGIIAAARVAVFLTLAIISALLFSAGQTPGAMSQFAWPFQLQQAVWQGLQGCIPGFWILVLLLAAYPRRGEALALAFGGYTFALLWTLALLELRVRSSNPGSYIITGGLIGYVEAAPAPWAWWLGLAVLLVLIASLRLRITYLSWACTLLLVWALIVMVSGGTPPYPVQATVPSAASTLHGIGAEMARPLYSLPWTVSFDGEVEPMRSTLEVPALGLGWSFRRDRLPWWFVLQVPFLVLMLCLPLALNSCLPVKSGVKGAP